MASKKIFDPDCLSYSELVELVNLVAISAGLVYDMRTDNDKINEAELKLVDRAKDYDCCVFDISRALISYAKNGVIQKPQQCKPNGIPVR